MNNSSLSLIRLVRLAGWALIASLAASAKAATAPVTTDIRAETALFIATGQGLRGAPESYVVPVVGAARIAEVRQYLADRSAGTEHRPLIAQCIVRLGNDGPNRNFSAPGTPLWGWQVVELVGVRRAQLELELYPASLEYTGSPSMVESLLRQNPSGLQRHQINFINFPIVMELSSEFPGGTRGNLTNLSDRGFVGNGDNAKITGFVVDGSNPRTVVIRVLGPSLAAFGVSNALANPRFALYRGSEKIAENDDWVDGNLNRPWPAIYPPISPSHLIPADKREPALEVSLTPGVYTIVVTSADGGSGIVLSEVHML